MPHTVKKEYRGWNVTLRCSYRVNAGDSGYPKTYTASALAELCEEEDPAHWVDSRVQVLHTGDRVFESGAHSIDELFSEVKDLVDALSRHAD